MNINRNAKNPAWSPAAKITGALALCLLAALTAAVFLRMPASATPAEKPDLPTVAENAREAALGTRELTSRRAIPAGQNQLRTDGTGWKQGITLADMAIEIGGVRIGRDSSPRQIERALAGSDPALEIEIRESAHDREEGLRRMGLPLRTSSAAMEMARENMTHATLTARSMYLSPWTAGLAFSVTNAGGAAPALPMDARLQNVTVFEHAGHILGQEVTGPLGLRIGMTAREVSGIFGDGPTEFISAGGDHVWWYSPDGSATTLAITFSQITHRVTQFTVHFGAIR